MLACQQGQKKPCTRSCPLHHTSQSKQANIPAYSFHILTWREIRGKDLTQLHRDRQGHLESSGGITETMVSTHLGTAESGQGDTVSVLTRQVAPQNWEWPSAESQADRP